MFEGIYAPIPTPFDRRGEIAWERLKENLDRWAATPLAGLVVLGTNGEFVYLDSREKERMVEFVRANFPADRKVIAGTGAESTRQTIQATRRAAELGADAVLVLNPHYYKAQMTPRALEHHYRQVADASPVPVMLYNMPRNTGLNLPPELICALSTHPNIVGIKDSSGNLVQIAQVCANAAEGFAVFAGSGSFLLAALAVGCVGGTLAVANIMARECVELMQAYRLGRLEEARRLQYRILPVNAAVTTRWGVPGLKAAMDMLGYYGGPPRAPLLPLEEGERSQLGEILRAAGLK